MSAYVEFTEIQFVNGELLVKALQEMGYHAEIGPALHLHGYMGDTRSQCAQIVVRRDQLSSVSNDLGFKRVGTAFVPVISDYDARHVLDQEWRDRLQATYSKLAVLKVLQKKSARLLGSATAEDGTIILKAEVLI